MATLLSALETQARYTLLEPTARFWSSAELIVHANDGIKDLWRGINDLHQEHFLTVDITNVSLAANSSSLTGVPADCYRVHYIEPRDLTDTEDRGIRLYPRDLNDQYFQYLRGLSAQAIDAGMDIFYAIINAGAPVAAPTIKVAPQITSALNLTLCYVPTLAVLTASGTNPIPGESDAAIVAWIIAYARAKEREDRSPDPEWLAIYATLKAGLMQSLTPRQDAEPDVVEPLFGDFW